MKIFCIILLGLLAFANALLGNVAGACVLGEAMWDDGEDE